MILEDATFEAFGYEVWELKSKSGKPIIAACELCGEFRVCEKHLYHTFCQSCAQRGKHRTEEHKRKMSEGRKGIACTEETKRKISKGNKGKIRSDECKRENSNAHRGKHLTEVTKRRISESEKGKRCSEETKQLISNSHKGALNPNWQGGISFEPYCIKFNNDYKCKIRILLGNICFLCGKTEEENGKALDVHHVNYNKNCGCDSSKCVCVPLCHSCHMKTNGNRSYWQTFITNKLKETIWGWI